MRWGLYSRRMPLIICWGKSGSCSGYLWTSLNTHNWQFRRDDWNDQPAAPRNLVGREITWWANILNGRIENHCWESHFYRFFGGRFTLTDDATLSRCCKFGAFKLETIHGKGTQASWVRTNQPTLINPKSNHNCELPHGVPIFFPHLKRWIFRSCHVLWRARSHWKDAVGSLSLAGYA